MKRFTPRSSRAARVGLEGVSTSFGAVSALRDVRLELAAVEAHDPFTFNAGDIDRFNV